MGVRTGKKSTGFVCPEVYALRTFEGGKIVDESVPVLVCDLLHITTNTDKKSALSSHPRLCSFLSAIPPTPSTALDIRTLGATQFIEDTMADKAYEPKRVSTRKGDNRKQGQTYKNAYAFHANKGSRLTKKIASMPVGGLCEKCVDVIMWRKKFKKYKPLTTMKKW